MIQLRNEQRISKNCQKKNVNSQQTHEKVFSIISLQGTGNENHKIQLLTPARMAIKQRQKEPNDDTEVSEGENLNTIGKKYRLMQTLQQTV